MAFFARCLLVTIAVLSFRLQKRHATSRSCRGSSLASDRVLAVWLEPAVSHGYRVLRFATLVPVVIAFALAPAGYCAHHRRSQSARPVQTAIGKLTREGADCRGLRRAARHGIWPGVLSQSVHPELRTQRNSGNGDHVVVAASGSQKELEYRLPGRSVTRVGGFRSGSIWTSTCVSGRAFSQAHP